ncbi:hypothetical protein FOZ62_003053, partial [Perkinsus olseni]
MTPSRSYTLDGTNPSVRPHEIVFLPGSILRLEHEPCPPSCNITLQAQEISRGRAAEALCWSGPFRWESCCFYGLALPRDAASFNPTCWDDTMDPAFCCPFKTLEEAIHARHRCDLSPLTESWQLTKYLLPDCMAEFRVEEWQLPQACEQFVRTLPETDNGCSVGGLLVSLALYALRVWPLELNSDSSPVWRNDSLTVSTLSNTCGGIGEDNIGLCKTYFNCHGIHNHEHALVCVACLLICPDWLSLGDTDWLPGLSYTLNTVLDLSSASDGPSLLNEEDIAVEPAAALHALQVASLQALGSEHPVVMVFSWERGLHKLAHHPVRVEAFEEALDASIVTATLPETLSAASNLWRETWMSSIDLLGRGCEAACDAVSLSAMTLSSVTSGREGTPDDYARRLCLWYRWSTRQGLDAGHDSLSDQGPIESASDEPVRHGLRYLQQCASGQAQGMPAGWWQVRFKDYEETFEWLIQGGSLLRIGDGELAIMDARASAPHVRPSDFALAFEGLSRLAGPRGGRGS